MTKEEDAIYNPSIGNIFCAAFLKKLRLDMSPLFVIPVTIGASNSHNSALTLL
ncbi:MAG: hypothetical protein IKP84_02180 [Prevotella sp.]|nr:hypothetical protein [Prevotella sp.]